MSKHTLSYLDRKFDYTVEGTTYRYEGPRYETIQEAREAWTEMRTEWARYRGALGREDSTAKFAEMVTAKVQDMHHCAQMARGIAYEGTWDKAVADITLREWMVAAFYVTTLAEITYEEARDAYADAALIAAFGEC